MLPTMSLSSPTSNPASYNLSPVKHALLYTGMLTTCLIVLLVAAAYQVGQAVAESRYLEERRQFESAMATVQVALWKAEATTRLVDSVQAQLGAKGFTTQSRIP